MAAAAAATEIERAGASIGELTDRKARLRVRVDEAERAHAELVVPASLDEQRVALASGEPCPLCGSKEHPWRDSANRALGGALQRQSERLRQLRGEVIKVERDLATLTEARRQARRGAQASAEGAEADEEVIEREARRYAELRATAGEGGGLALPPQPGLAALSTSLAHWRAVASSHEALLAAEVRVDKARQRCLEAELELQRPLEALRAADQARQGLAEQLRGHTAVASTQLDGVPGWPARFDTSPGPWRQQLADSVDGLRLQLERRDQAAKAVDELTAQLRGAEAAHRVAISRRDDMRATVDEQRRARAEVDARMMELTRDLGVVAFQTLYTRLQETQSTAAKATAVADERRRRLAAHAEGAPTWPEPCEPGQVQTRLAACQQAEAAARAVVQRLKARSAAHEEAVAAGLENARELGARRDGAARWIALSDLIGHHSGKAFQQFAQSLTLDLLVAHANRQLEELAPRYQLMRVPGYDLELQLIDRDLGDDVRTIRSLSGGETFLVSLSLALSLASVASSSTNVETLFIDEGFGTLDARSLEIALAALDTLQAGGRQVGIISHVPGLAERVGVQVAVVPRGPANSVVRIG